MSKAFPILWLFIALGFISLWLWKITYAGAAPPPRLIHDMSTRPEYPMQAPPPGAVPYMPTEQSSGEDAAELFSLHCAACHGVGGNGKSYVAAQPGMPDVGDLTAPSSTPEERASILAEGRGAMPAFEKRLTTDQRNRLIDYILIFVKK